MILRRDWSLLVQSKSKALITEISDIAEAATKAIDTTFRVTISLGKLATTFAVGISSTARVSTSDQITDVYFK